MAERLYPDFPGRATKRKLHGGPWAGESIGFREDQTELVVVKPVIGGEDDLGYVGRYVVRKIQQKNRVITRVEWETTEQKAAFIRKRLRELPFI